MEVSSDRSRGRETKAGRRHAAAPVQLAGGRSPVLAGSLPYGDPLQLREAEGPSLRDMPPEQLNAEGRKRKDAKDYAGALPYYEALYHHQDVDPDWLPDACAGMGTCLQGTGRFDEAIEHYLEYNDLPERDYMDHRTSLQRIRECRQGLPPGRSERGAAGQPVDPNDRSDGHRTLYAGCRGPDVREVQMKLNAAGAADPALDTNGEFGSKTSTAVVKFQKDKGLLADGVVGPQTWAALDTVSGDRAPDQEHLAALDALEAEAVALRRAEQWDAALAAFWELYIHPKAGPEYRATGCSGLGTCYHAKGEFDKAISYYDEYLDIPAETYMTRRTALERIKQCRQGKPPGKTENEQAATPVDPNERSDAHPWLRLGDVGTHVEELHMKLNAAGVASPSLRGKSPKETEAPVVFDGRTRQAVLQFQTTRGLGADGVVGPQTWAALDRVSGSRCANQAEIAELNAIEAKAHADKEAGSYESGLAGYQKLYDHPKCTIDWRGEALSGLATCHHWLKHWDAAIGYYREYLSLPDRDAGNRQVALERTRKCRRQELPR